MRTQPDSDEDDSSDEADPDGEELPAVFRSCVDETGEMLQEMRRALSKAKLGQRSRRNRPTHKRPGGVFCSILDSYGRC